MNQDAPPTPALMRIDGDGRLMNLPHTTLNRVPIDLALIIALTLACTIFALTPRLGESPVRVVVGLLLVLFLPRYSLVAALFPRKDDLDGIERIALSFGLSIAVVPLIGLGLNYTSYGIWLVPVLLGPSLFTILLAVVAGVRRVWMPEVERFVVEGWGPWLGRGGDGRSGGGGEGRGGGLA